MNPPKKLKLTSLPALERASELLKILAHPHRLRIVQLLLQGKYTVGELGQACGIPSHMASEHLRLLQHCNFLERQREGRKTYYRIAEAKLRDIMACIERHFAE